MTDPSTERCARFAAATERVRDLALTLKPKDRRLLARVEDVIGSIRRFPVELAELFLSKHLMFAARMKLSLFLLANRCPPALMAEWYVTRGMLHDKAAKEMVISIIKAHMEGKLEEGGKTAYVIDTTLSNGDPAPPALKRVPVYTPNFAYDTEFQHFWLDAVCILRGQPTSHSLAEDSVRLHNLSHSPVKRARVSGTSVPRR